MVVKGHRCSLVCGAHLAKSTGDIFMHVELTRQSVVIKCNLEASIMTGNYELYYAAGLLAKLMDRELPADIQPDALHDLVHGWLDDFTPADGHETHLAHMLKYYHPDADLYDAQMAELLQMGLHEQRMWERFT